MGKFYAYHGVGPYCDRTPESPVVIILSAVRLKIHMKTLELKPGNQNDGLSNLNSVTAQSVFTSAAHPLTEQCGYRVAIGASAYQRWKLFWVLEDTVRQSNRRRLS